MRRFILPAFAVAVAPVHSAEAVGFMTQLSCASDYYAYCSKHPVGSKELRQCMNANGPKLSKSCINALIADGEISKEEVARRRDQLLAAKKPAKAEPVQPSAVAELAKTDAAKEKLPRAEAKAAKPVDSQAPVRLAAVMTLTLDQKTFEALKNRGNYFVVDAGDVVPTAFDDTPRVIATSDPAQAVGAATPSIAATVPPVAAAEALAEPQKSVRPAEDPPGKMALGKKPSLEQPQPPPVAVEIVEPPKPSSAETWLNYMKNRFEGGMNYQGVDANF